MSQVRVFNYISVESACPLCGSEDTLKVVEIDGLYSVRCGACWIHGPMDKCGTVAIEKWNALSNPPSQECANESQVEELDGVNYCPMCGECPEVYVDWWPSGGSSVQVACECGVHGSIGRSEQEAIEYWNMLSGSDGGWISVEDELPKTGVHVLVFASCLHYTPVSFASLQEDRETWCIYLPCTIDGFRTSLVTHWQPLPEKPVMKLSRKDVIIKAHVFLSQLREYIEESEALFGTE